MDGSGRVFAEPGLPLAASRPKGGNANGNGPASDAIGTGGNTIGTITRNVHVNVHLNAHRGAFAQPAHMV